MQNTVLCAPRTDKRVTITSRDFNTLCDGCLWNKCELHTHQSAIDRHRSAIGADSLSYLQDRLALVVLEIP